MTFSAESGCTPAILATASGVYDEAVDILYEKNVVDIVVDKQTGGIHVAAWRFPDPGTSFDLCWPCEQVGTLPILYEGWGRALGFLKYMKRVRIVIEAAEFAGRLARICCGLLDGEVLSEIQTLDQLSKRLFGVVACLQACGETELREVVVDVRGCFTEKYRVKIRDVVNGGIARLWGKMEVCLFYFVRERRW